MAEDLKATVKCTLPTLVRDYNCKGCEGCGWEKSERDRRREHIRAHGLTLFPDGLWRLLIINSERSEMK